MTHITLESIKTAHTEVGAMIAAYESQALRVVALPKVDIELRPGESYAGVSLGANGAPSHHLVLLPGELVGAGWDAAKAFATKLGGDLPTRSEQALLFANLKGEFKEATYWSSEQHAANAVYAWCQDFNGGFQFDFTKSASLRARAVRRLIIS